MTTDAKTETECRDETHGQLTWGEFKRCVEAQGLGDDHVMQFVDINGYDRPRVTFETIQGKRHFHVL